MYKLCIFDLDGTLTDTLESLTFSVNKTLRAMGLSEISQNRCRELVGNGARVLMERALLEAGETNVDRIEEAMRIYGRIFAENCTYHVVPYEGIPEMLERMKQQGLRLAVLSNKPHGQAIHVVETIFGKDMFCHIQGQQPNIPRKPDPEAALQIADMCGSLPRETIYVGDSEVDIATGMAAHMRTIGVTWGFRSRAVLEEAGARDLAGSPEEVMKLIKE